MSQDTWPNGSYADLADLAGRREALRQAAAMPGADPRALLDAAFAELDAAVEALTKPSGEPDRTAGEALTASLNAERSLLRAVFQHVPAALFVLEPDGTIRRANGRAGDLIGAPPGYATGKPVTAFVDLASRAAVQSQLAAAARTRTTRTADCTLLGPAGLDLSAAYVPASEGLEVSGDFYDVFPVQGGWAITVGDVCGKGQEAAAMTGAARHAIRVIAHWNPDPVDVLAKVNEVILAGGYEDRFVTAKLAYLRWDGDHLRVELASSGHPGPAVVRPDGRVDVLSGGGLPLGLFPDAEPERESRRARPRRPALLLLRRGHGRAQP